MKKGGLNLLFFMCYLNRSYALTNASSAPIPRIANQLRMIPANGKQMVHEALNVVSSANMKIYATKAK